jgi:hypothetical protein
VGADVALLHQLLNMKVDWGHTCECFSSPLRAGFKGAGDPETGVSLLFQSKSRGPFIAAPS